MQLGDYSMTDWEKCMVWETLERLECTEVGFLPQLSAPLKGLLSLTVHHSEDWDSWQRDELREFVGNASKLEHLQVTNMTEMMVYNGCAEPRGHCLKSLRIHEHQIYDPTLGNRYVLNCEGVQYLGRLCPQLHTFGLDLRVGSDWVRMPMLNLVLVLALVLTDHHRSL